MLSFLGRFAKGVFRYFSTSLDELAQSAIDFFVRQHSKPTITARASTRSGETSKQSPESAESAIPSSKILPTCQGGVSSTSTIVHLPLPQTDTSISFLGSTLNSGSLSIDGPLTISYFPGSPFDTNLPQPAMSFADKYSAFVCLASFLWVCVIFCRGCFWLRKQAKANDITISGCPEAKSVNPAFPPLPSSFTRRARLVSLPDTEDEETSTSSASPTLSFSQISNIANYSPEANEGQSDAVDDEEQVIREDAGNKCHTSRTYYCQYHQICPAQEIKPEDPPQKVTAQVTVEQEQVKEAVQQALAPLKDELIKELNANSVSNLDIMKPLVEGLFRTVIKESAIGDLVDEVRLLSEDMKAVKKYTGAGEDQDNALQRLSKGSLRSQFDAVDVKIKQLPTCCEWATGLSRDVALMSLKLRRDLAMYGRRGSAGRKVAKLPRDLDILEARVDTVLGHRCGESKELSFAEAQPSDSSTDSIGSSDSNTARHGSSSKAKEAPRPSLQPVPEFLPEPFVESALQSAPLRVTQPNAQSRTRTRISPVAELARAEANVVQTSQESVAAADATTSDQLAYRPAGKTKPTEIVDDTESQLVKSFDRFRQKYIDMLLNLKSRVEQLSMVPGSEFEAAADYLRQEILSHLETLRDFRVSSLKFQVLVEPMGPIVTLLEQKFNELKESLSEHLRRIKVAQHDPPPPCQDYKDDYDTDLGYDHPGCRVCEVATSPSSPAKTSEPQSRQASETNSTSKASDDAKARKTTDAIVDRITLAATEERNDGGFNENEPEEAPKSVPEEEELKAEESKVPSTIVEHKGVIGTEDPVISPQDSLNSEIPSAEAVDQPDGGNNEMEVEDEGYNPTNARIIPQALLCAPPTNIGHPSEALSVASLASVPPLLQQTHQETNTVLPQDLEMSDNPPASQPLPSVNGNFTPFFGAEGLEDIDIDPAPANSLSPSWEDPATDPNIAAFLRGQNSPGTPDQGPDAIPIPEPASGEGMDGVERQYTQPNDDTVMGLDEPSMANPPMNTPADDEDMKDVSAPPAQLPSTQDPVTATETAPIQSIEMGDTPVLDQQQPGLPAVERANGQAASFPTEREILDAIPAEGIDMNFFADWFSNFTCAEERRQELCEIITSLLEETQNGLWVRRAPVAVNESGLQDTTPYTKPVMVQDPTVLTQTAFPTAEEVRIAIDLNPGSTSYDLLQKFPSRVPAGRRKEWETLVKENTDQGPSYKKDLKRYPKPGSSNVFQSFNVPGPPATCAFSNSAPRPTCDSGIATNFNLDPQKVDIGYEVELLAPPDLPLPRKNLSQGDRPGPTPDIDWSSIVDTATPNNSCESATTSVFRPQTDEEVAIGDKTASPSKAAASPSKTPDGNLPKPEAIAAAIPIQGIPLDELEALFDISPEQKVGFWSLFEQVGRHIEWSNWCFRLPPFPTGREIWEVIPPEDEEGILMEDLLEKFKGRVPHCLMRRFEESVERHAVQLNEDEPEWNQKPRPQWRRDVTYGPVSQDNALMTPRTLPAYPLPCFGTQPSSSAAQAPRLRLYPTADEVYYAIPPSGIRITALKAIFEDRIACEPSDKFNAILAAVSRKVADLRHRKLSYMPTTLPPAPRPNTSGPKKPVQAITEPRPSDWSNPNTGCRDPNCRMTEEHDCGAWLLSDSEEEFEDEEDFWAEVEFRKQEELQRQEFLRKKEAGMLPIPKSRKSRVKTIMPPNPDLGGSQMDCTVQEPL